MLTFCLINKKKNNIKVIDKIKYILFYKDQLKYLKTIHLYYLIDSSLWPFVISLVKFIVTSSLILYNHKFIGGTNKIKNYV